ncbi:DUF6468 domain-containing protein [Pannonibacter carbonis]|uniref:DUF6468 domain-containing protein n=1 Tax=Pannonibacter carbonis TaxID=2067569 RepID=UPI000D0EDD59|nr:DUF6468 domain-containing protein [Pannonibacter carbonis]
MSPLPIGMIIESLVAVLLVVTIGYCWILNRRLQRLRADEETLRATISELITATEIAERAILGLKATANEADKTLGTRLSQAEQMSKLLADQLGEGEQVLTRIAQIAEAARTAHTAEASRRVAEDQAEVARSAAQAAQAAAVHAARPVTGGAHQPAYAPTRPAAQGYVAPQPQPRPTAPAYQPSSGSQFRQPMSQSVAQTAAQHAVQPQGQAPSAQPAVPVSHSQAGVSTRDIRAAAAEATARLERFRKKSEEAAA